MRCCFEWAEPNGGWLASYFAIPELDVLELGLELHIKGNTLVLKVKLSTKLDLGETTDAEKKPNETRHDNRAVAPSPTVATAASREQTRLRVYCNVGLPWQPAQLTSSEAAEKREHPAFLLFYYLPLPNFLY